ncbi:MAG TPA: hypothetical protein VE985_04985 [Gaiellaceae bacterium]|nr:hypothetical protein [Gaiellaceae bacterium]
MLRSIGWLAWVIVAYLLAAAAFELVLALRHSISPAGEGWILLAALVAMLVGTVLVFRGVGPAGLFAPAAALFVTARFYTGDPYYGSTFRAYGDGGVFSPVWVVGLLGCAFVAGAATQLWRRTAPVESAAVLLLLAFTALFMGTGH